MPFLKTARAPVSHASVEKGWWNSYKNDIVCQNGQCFLAGRRMKTAEKAVLSYHPKEWLLSHVSIMASVDTEDGYNPRATYKDYLITPETSIFTNNNGDSWEKRLLLSTFRTFIGSENYVEHVQNPALSKGKIIDAVSREVPVYHPIERKQMVYPDGRPVTSVYIDILVATSRRFEELTNMIEIGQANSMSMGCLLKFTICSECGRVIYREQDTCEHIRENKRGSFTDQQGLKRITSELCGHYTDPDSCCFVEASWVVIPAFRGAVRRNVLNLDTFAISSKLKKAHKLAADRFHSIYKPKENALSKLASMNSKTWLDRIIEISRME